MVPTLEKKRFGSSKLVFQNWSIVKDDHKKVRNPHRVSECRNESVETRVPKFYIPLYSSGRVPLLLLFGAFFLMLWTSSCDSSVGRVEASQAFLWASILLPLKLINIGMPKVIYKFYCSETTILDISPESRTRTRATQQGCAKCGETSPCQWS